MQSPKNCRSDDASASQRIEAKLFCGRIPNPLCPFKRRVISCVIRGYARV